VAYTLNKIVILFIHHGAGRWRVDLFNTVLFVPGPVGRLARYAAVIGYLASAAGAVFAWFAFTTTAT
jgi:hypothetical protein